MIICEVSGLEPGRTLRCWRNYLLVDIDIPVVQKQKEMQIREHGCESEKAQITDDETARSVIKYLAIWKLASEGSLLFNCSRSEASKLLRGDN